MQLSPSARLGPFEIIAPLGAGGMGEVYRARDTRLDRQVAIKVLSLELSANAAMRERFEREARAVSQLSHPHICTLFDIGSHEGTDYLVMEYLEGETLADRLSKGAMPLDEVLEYGAQIAEALDKAHRQGIVHRDLKPGNIMLTRAGAKLLDFGLAKLSIRNEQPLGGLTSFPTEQKNLTQEGTILGTFQYMAPEQLEGVDADGRTDIFAFGAVLYEMVTGRKAFEGKTRTSLIAAIVDRDPRPIAAAQPLTPPALEHLILKCLEKDPESRWQSAADIGSQLRWIAEGGSQAGVAAPVVIRRKNRERAAWILAAVALLVSGALAFALWRAASEPRQRVELSLTSPPDTSVVLNASGSNVALSPDGTRVVFRVRSETGEDRLFIRPLRTDMAQPLPGTEDAHAPFWSPDGRHIGFFAGGKLKRIDTTGGPPQTLCDASGTGGYRGGTWNKDGVIIFSPAAREPLYRIAATGGKPEPITKIDGQKGEYSHRFPVFLPDGKHYLYLSRTGAHSGEIRVGSLEGGPAKELISVDSPPFYAEPGYILFVRERVLFAQEFNPRTHELGSDAMPLAENIQHYASAAQSVVSAGGRVLVFQHGSSIAQTQMAWVDRTGTFIEDVGPLRSNREFSLSPDGRQVAVAIRDEQTGNDDIWIQDLVRGSATRLTFSPFSDDHPVWTPDGLEVIYGAEQENRGFRDLMIKKSSGEGEATALYATPSLKIPTDVSSDGNWVAFSSLDVGVGTILDVVALSRTDKKVVSIAATPFQERGGAFSPDRKWVAYASNESGVNEVYVQRWPPEGGGKWQVSIGGGESPAWRRDGREFFYFSEKEDGIMAVSITSDSSFEAGRPLLLFKEPRLRNSVAWTPSNDGNRFLITRVEREVTRSPLTVIVNWSEGLEQ